MLKRLFILAAIALASCTYDDAEDYNPQMRLMFQPGMYMHVAHEEVERFPTEQSIAVRAWSLPDTSTWEQATHQAIEYIPLQEARSREVFITDTTLRETVKDTLWVITENTMWPSKNEHLTFMAFSPFGAECSCNIEEGITYTVNTLKNQTDLLYTAPHSNRNKINNGWVVPLRFQHALCRMDFRIKHRVADNEKITVTKITVDEVHNQGTFKSLSTPQWELETQLEPLTFFEGTREIAPLPDKIGHYWLLIPQQLDTRVTVEYTYTNAAGNTIAQKLKTTQRLRTNLAAGQTYTYTLSVGIDDIKFLQEIIED